LREKTSQPARPHDFELTDIVDGADRLPESRPNRGGQTLPGLFTQYAADSLVRTSSARRNWK
jgi:hypothetical protein